LFSELVPLIDEPRGMIIVEPHHITKPELKRDFMKIMTFFTIFKHKKGLFWVLGKLTKITIKSVVG
jgi:hypothetical protein